MRIRLAALLAGATIVLASPAVLAAEFINVLTGGTSGVYYPLGVALTQIYGKAIPEAKASVQATKASAENLNLLQAGRGEIAFTLGDALGDAWKGEADAGFNQAAGQQAALAELVPAIRLAKFGVFLFDFKRSLSLLSRDHIESRLVVLVEGGEGGRLSVGFLLQVVDDGKHLFSAVDPL